MCPIYMDNSEHSVDMFQSQAMMLVKAKPSTPSHDLGREGTNGRKGCSARDSWSTVRGSGGKFDKHKEHPRGPPAKVLALDPKKALSHNKNLSLMRLRGHSKIF